MAAAVLPEHHFEDADALDAWLAEHHATIDAVWLRIAKQGSGVASVTWKQAVPVLLRWGWIDGQLRKIDDDWYACRIGQRRPRSVWSKVNVAHAERLIAEGRMEPAGLARVDAAKADGRWAAAYDSPSKMGPPPELQAALDADPAAAAAWEQLAKSERYSICWRIHSVKRAETKQRHVDRALERLRGEDDDVRA